MAVVGSGQGGPRIRRRSGEDLGGFKRSSVNPRPEPSTTNCLYRNGTASALAQLLLRQASTSSAPHARLQEPLPKAAGELTARVLKEQHYNQ
jgi:hypothetical protein